MLQRKPSKQTLELKISTPPRAKLSAPSSPRQMRILTPKASFSNKGQKLNTSTVQSVVKAIQRVPSLQIQPINANLVKPFHVRSFRKSKNPLSKSTNFKPFDTMHKQYEDYISMANTQKLINSLKVEYFNSEPDQVITTTRPISSYRPQNKTPTVFKTEPVQASFRISTQNLHSNNISNNVSSFRPSTTYRTHSNATTQRSQRLSEMVFKNTISRDDKIVRSIFVQLLQAVHESQMKGDCYQDLQLMNIVVEENLKVSIAESEYFDMSKQLGVINYRGPEVLEGNIKDPWKADIYSLGIILFLLKFHMYPYIEDARPSGINVMELLMKNPKGFWNFFYFNNKIRTKIHPELQGLIQSMLNADPKCRPDIQEILRHPWIKGGQVMKRKEILLLGHKIRHSSMTNLNKISL